MPNPITITISGTDYLQLKFEAEKLVDVLSAFCKLPGQGALAAREAAPAATEPKKAGRPTKEEPRKETPVETDKTVTADHPKRAELLKKAKEYATATDKATAQAAVKLFGENTSLVPDNQLAEAILHISNKLKKLDKSDVGDESL